jgi:hypothetical protein
LSLLKGKVTMAELDIESIKERIDNLKAEKARAEGQKQTIEETWKRDFGVSTLEEAEDLMAKMQKELADYKTAQEEYLSAADKLLSEAGV